MINEKCTDNVEAWLRRHREEKVEIISYLDSRYPEKLRYIHDFPLIIFCRGDVSLLKSQKIFGVVGTRGPSNYGRKVVMDVVSGLVENDFVVVSGMAMGIDALAHRGALEKSGKTIGVIGSGIDVIYPPNNESLYYNIVKEGLVISEYELGAPTRAHQFPERNRIISGLSLGIIVIEAAIKSGSLITAKLAIDQNRDVFAVPGQIYAPTSQGCNRLLQLGAAMYTSVDDIILEYPNLRNENAEIPHLHENTKVVIDILKKHGAINTYELLNIIDTPNFRLDETIKELEFQKIVRKTGNLVQFYGI
jgi:DNA processing protein